MVLFFTSSKFCMYFFTVSMNNGIASVFVQMIFFMNKFKSAASNQACPPCAAAEICDEIS